ncbi:MAG: ABC transporter substrate-binding protein [Deltaproteobacteria bacterium]|nr:ABC transporter substrate-binding protein [Deltaproteobacteria bacterium]
MKVIYPNQINIISGAGGWSLVLFIISLLLTVLFSFPMGIASAREIVDMAGRKVIIPDSIKKVYVPSAYGSYLVYSIDPSMLVSFNSPDKQYLNKAVHDLPDIGKLSGEDKQSNLERLHAAKPDLVIMWTTKKTSPTQPGRMAETLDQLNLPVVYAVAETFNDYPEIYLFLGNVLGREERAKKLSDYFRKTLTDIKNVVEKTSQKKRPTVYYAEKDDGLSTECDDSIHVEMLKYTGDTNIHRCHTSGHMGFEKMTMEDIYKYNPDFIIAQSREFYNSVVKEKDSAWQQVKAVKEGKVYLIPRTPFNWFDRPPSFMRLMGLKWLTNMLYPDEYKIDIIKDSREFYSLFLGVDVSDEEMKGIIYR